MAEALRVLQADDSLLCSLEGLRNLAMQYARDKAVQAVEELHDQRHALPSEVSARKRESTLRQLKRLAPGKSAALSVTTCRDGSAVTHSDDIAAALREHWQLTFAKNN